MLWEVGASRRMMVLLEKQVHLVKEVGAVVDRMLVECEEGNGVGVMEGTYSMRR